MNFRKISIVVGVIIIFGGFFAMKQISNSKAPPKRKAAANPKRMVLVQEVQNTNTPVQVDITGKLIAKNRIEVFAEVSGKLLQKNKEFKPGVNFQKGEALIFIDNNEFKLNLFAAKSNFLNQLTQLLPDLKLDYPNNFEAWKSYVDQFEIESALKELPEVTEGKLKSFIATKNIYNTFYQIKSQEERLKKYHIIAPFSGVVSTALITEGTLVRPNQKLGEFINPGVYEIESAIRVSDLDFITVGDTVEFTSTDIPGIWLGNVSRVSKNINAATQTFSVFCTVSGSDLKEGMFLNGKIKGKTLENVFSIDRKLLLENNAIYAVQDSTLIVTPVEIQKFSNQSVLVKGLKNGDIILKESIIGAFDGLPVQPVKEAE